MLEIWHDTRDSAEMKLYIFEEGVPVIAAKSFQMKVLDPVLDEWNMEPYASPDKLKGAIGKPSKSTFLVAMNAAVYEIPSLPIGDTDIGPIRFGYIGNPYRELNSDPEQKEFLQEFDAGVPHEVQRYDGRDHL